MTLAHPSYHPMPQQTTLNAYFAVATPEQITQNNERRTARLCNDFKTKQAFIAVSAARRAEKLIEKRLKSGAQRSREYRARLKAANKSSGKQVGLAFIAFYHH